MKERPILFSGPMVRAIIEGRKTQTRRILTVPWKGSTRALPHEPYYVEEDGRLLVDCSNAPDSCGGGDYREASTCLPCPYGQPGGRLWVRETSAVLTGAGHRVVYRADGDPEQLHYPGEKVPDVKWKPSIFMRRHESRLTLEVTEVRVERLQAITEADARAEGCDWDLAKKLAGGDEISGPDSGFEMALGFNPRLCFEHLWDSINADRASWASNPWVWVVSFKAAEARR